MKTADQNFVKMLEKAHPNKRRQYALDWLHGKAKALMKSERISYTDAHRIVTDQNPLVAEAGGV